MDAAMSNSEADALRAELQVARRKLDSKCEALLILSRDLDQCRQERDQFQLMAEQVQARYQSMKRQLAGVAPRQSAVDNAEFGGMKQQSLAHLLCEMRDANKSLQFEVDDLKQKLKDANGDIKMLREQIVRQRVGATDEGLDTHYFAAHEREKLVAQLESSADRISQLERDLQQVIDEKEELVSERDVYRVKYDRLNKELNYILKGDERRVLDIDALINENKYMQERVRQVEDEKAMALATISKYKSILDKKKNKGILKLGQHRTGGVVVSQKQVHQLLENGQNLTATPQMLSDLQSLSAALLESLNDKNVALSHHRKTNRLLGERVAELEKKVKSLEMSEMWNVTEKAASLLELRQLCTETSDLLTSSLAATAELSCDDSAVAEISCDVSSPAANLHGPADNDHIDSPADKTVQLHSSADNTLDIHGGYCEEETLSDSIECNLADLADTQHSVNFSSHLTDSCLSKTDDASLPLGLSTPPLPLSLHSTPEHASEDTPLHSPTLENETYLSDEATAYDSIDLNDSDQDTNPFCDTKDPTTRKMYDLGLPTDINDAAESEDYEDKEEMDDMVRPLMRELEAKLTARDPASNLTASGKLSLLAAEKGCKQASEQSKLQKKELRSSAVQKTTDTARLQNRIAATANRQQSDLASYKDVTEMGC